MVFTSSLPNDPELSVTVMVNENVHWEVVQAVVGIVPDSTPVVLASVSPEGRPVCPVPVLTAHVYGVTPPVALNCAEYGTPTTAAGRLVVVIDTPDTTVSVSDLLAVWFAANAGKVISVNSKTHTSNFFG